MNKTELNERTEQAQEIVESELGGGERFFGSVLGTGWKQGTDGLFVQENEIPYEHLNIPGIGAEVEGHVKSMKVGYINGRPALILGRVHANEESLSSDANQAMRVIIGAVRDRLDGLLITNGVGTLHGPVGREKGLLRSMIQTAILDTMGWAVRGRRQERINVGDIAIVDDVMTLPLGPYTPLVAGEFEDYYHGGIHRDGDRYFRLGHSAVVDVQGECSRAVYCYMTGPQFEGPTDKRIFRALGGDVMGMSGIQDILAAVRAGIPFVNLGFATNGPFGKHSHEENQRIGLENAPKMGKVIEVLADRWPRAADSMPMAA